jgi:hypothetical protein
MLLENQHGPKNVGPNIRNIMLSVGGSMGYQFIFDESF